MFTSIKTIGRCVDEDIVEEYVLDDRSGFSLASLKLDPRTCLIFYPTFLLAGM